jgi:hypothetical protein
METPMSRRNESSDAANEFQIDVITYGAIFYNALRSRKDFEVLEAQESRVRRKSRETSPVD